MKQKTNYMVLWQYEQNQDLSEYTKIKQKWGYDLLEYHFMLDRLKCSFIGSLRILYVDIDTGEISVFITGEYALYKAFNRFVDNVKIDWLFYSVEVSLGK